MLFLNPLPVYPEVRFAAFEKVAHSLPVSSDEPVSPQRVHWQGRNRVYGACAEFVIDVILGAEWRCGFLHDEESGVRSGRQLALTGASWGRVRKFFFTFLTVLLPIGSLLTSSANKNRFSPVMTNGDYSVLSAVAQNNDYGSPRHPDVTALPVGKESAPDAEPC